MARVVFSKVTAVPGAPGKASSKSRAYSGIALSSWTSISGFWSISMGDVMGKRAWSSRSGARPSQNCRWLKAEFQRVGAPRFTTAPPVRAGPRPRPPFPIDCPRPSEKPRSGWWQVAHDISFAPETMGSKKSNRPRATRFGHAGSGRVLGAGNGRRSPPSPGARERAGRGLGVSGGNTGQPRPTNPARATTITATSSHRKRRTFIGFPS